MIELVHAMRARGCRENSNSARRSATFLRHHGEEDQRLWWELYKNRFLKNIAQRIENARVLCLVLLFHLTVDTGEVVAVVAVVGVVAAAHIIRNHLNIFGGMKRGSLMHMAICMSE